MAGDQQLRLSKTPAPTSQPFRQMESMEPAHFIAGLERRSVSVDVDESSEASARGAQIPGGQAIPPGSCAMDTATINPLAGKTIGFSSASGTWESRSAIRPE
jgi:hypothetical protein